MGLHSIAWLTAIARLHAVTWLHWGSLHAVARLHTWHRWSTIRRLTISWLLAVSWVLAVHLRVIFGELCLFVILVFGQADSLYKLGSAQGGDRKGCKEGISHLRKLLISMQ